MLLLSASGRNSVYGKRGFDLDKYKQQHWNWHEINDHKWTGRERQTGREVGGYVDIWVGG